jgi:UDPglucose 6-dehydrogenase
MRVAVIGLGKLGAPMAAVFASKGHVIHAFDINTERADMLAAGVSPVSEPGVTELLQATTDGKIIPHTNIGAAAYDAQIVFVIVPTPSGDYGSFSNAFVEQVLDVIAVYDQAHFAVSPRLVAIVSTVSPGSMEQLSERFHAAVGRGRLAYNPEFVALGSVVKDMLNPDFVLIGEADPEDGELLADFYATLHDAPVKRMSWQSAEICKLSLNVALTIRISYANMVSQLCEQTPGASAHDVLRAVGSDRRIGRAYLASGTAYGGPCFPRDCRAYAAAAEAVEAPCDLAEAADAINGCQCWRLFDIIDTLDILDNLPEEAIYGVLGLAYKPGTDVVEKSAGMEIVAELVENGCNVIAHDPLASPRLPGDAHLDHDVRYVLMHCDVIIVALPCQEYRTVLVMLDETEGEKTVIDCWGMFRDQAKRDGVTVITLGESP